MNEAKPKIAALHITRVCDNKCAYCYLGDSDRTAHPPREKIERIVRELAKQGVEQIYFVGGDPCTYPFLTEMTKLSKNLGMRNSLLSNSLEFGSLLGEAISTIDCFEATILGHGPQQHDRVSGKRGSYEGLLKNIRKLNEHNLKVGIVLNATPATFDKFFQAIKNLVEKEKLFVSYVMVQRVIPMGRAKGVLEHGISKKQARVLFEELQKIGDVYKLPIIFEDAFPFCIVDKKFHKMMQRCEWGFTKCALDCEGNVSRCGSDPRYQLGNIFKESLQEIWKKSKTLKDFRGNKWLPPKCKKCRLVERCHGGCSLSNITKKDHDWDILITNDK